MDFQTVDESKNIFDGGGSAKKSSPLKGQVTILGSISKSSEWEVSKIRFASEDDVAIKHMKSQTKAGGT